MSDIINAATHLNNINADFEAIHNKKVIYDSNEIGMRHRNTRSHVKIFDNGNIEMYDGDNTGITLNNKYQTVNLYGTALNFLSKNFNVRCAYDGFSINSYILNPQLYLLTSQGMKLKAVIGEKETLIQPFTQRYSSNNYDNLLNQLGIPNY